MKKLKASFKNVAIALVAVLFFSLTACDTAKEEIIKTDVALTETTTQEEVIDGYFEDVDAVSLEAFDIKGAEGGRMGRDTTRSFTRCATITHDKDAKTIVIDFGEGCEGPGGKVRTGKINITYTSRKYVPGAIWTFTPEDLTINGIAIEGVKTVTNVSASEDDYLSLNKVLAGGKATWPDGAFATRDSDKTVTWIREANPVNDEFHISGEASGVNKEGLDYSMEILSKMIYKRKCRMEGVHIAVQGLKSFTKGEENILIDFGDGACDNEITVTKDGESSVIDVTDHRRG